MHYEYMTNAHSLTFGVDKLPLQGSLQLDMKPPDHALKQ